MTDRELLEAAAKAAGYELFWVITDPMIRCNEPAHPDKTHNLWNPLTDDGDALRLAVRLRLKLNIGTEATFANDTVDGETIHWAREQHAESDPCAATRLAIVRAAAAIGV